MQEALGGKAIHAALRSVSNQHLFRVIGLWGRVRASGTGP